MTGPRLGEQVVTAATPADRERGTINEEDHPAPAKPGSSEGVPKLAAVLASGLWGVGFGGQPVEHGGDRRDFDPGLGGFNGVFEIAFAENRSEVLGAPNPLAAIQQVHWTVHKAFVDYQSAAEERRQLAADVGELIREFVQELVAAGWSEEQARDANVHELAATSNQPDRE